MSGQACLCHLEPKISLVGCLFGSKTGVVAAPDADSCLIGEIVSPPCSA